MNFVGKFDAELPDGAGLRSDAPIRIDSAPHQHSSNTITIPDAHLLFSGDYARSGTDLIVSDDLHRVVVPGYFHGEKRPTLVSPEGAPFDPKVIEALTGHVQYAQAAGTAVAAKVVGNVVKITGSASVVRNGVTITLNTGDVVYQNDVVQTGSGSTLGLVLIDGSTFNMTANARLMLNDLVYDATSTSNSSLITLVQGAASFVAGQVAKSGDMKVATPVATLGIRGTAVILDISATDGKVSISVVDQQDNAVHAVQVFDRNGTLIGTVTSNGSTLTLTPTATFEVLAQQTNKTPAQIQQEFQVFQQVLTTYDIGKQLVPSTPAPTDGKRGDATPQSTTTKFAGSTPIVPTDTPVTTFTEKVGGNTTNPGAAGGTPTVNSQSATESGLTGKTAGTPTETPTQPTPVVIITQTSVVELTVTPQITPTPVTPSSIVAISSGPGDHFGPVMSADGRFVTYDPDGAIFLYDRQSNTTITITPAGDGFVYTAPTISSDGRYIVYQGTKGADTFIFIYDNNPADANYQHTTQLLAGSSPAISGDGSRILIEHGGSSIGVYDQQGHVVATLTPAAAGTSGTVWKPAISADGHIIAFWSSNLTTAGGAGQLFTYDLSNGSIRAIASTTTGAGASAASVSADGHYVVYQSVASGGHSEIHLYDLATGQVVFSTASADGGSYNPVISPDGHFIIFASDARLTPTDKNDVADTYVVDVTDLAHPVYKLVSVLADGTAGNGASNLGAGISAGGLYVAFGSSASNFSTGDTNGTGDIFVVDPSAGYSTVIPEKSGSTTPLTGEGTIKLTGGATIQLNADGSIPVTRDAAAIGTFTARLDADGNVHWTYTGDVASFSFLQPGQISTQTFVITLKTATGATTSIPVKVNIYDADLATVTKVNVAPVASIVALAKGTEDAPYTITAADLLKGVADIDGPSLSITAVTIKTGGGSIVNNPGGTWTYTPASGFNGAVVFDYTASDGSLTATSTATLNIDSANDAPTDILLTNASVAENTPAGTIIGTLSAVEPDLGDTVTFALIDNPGGAFALDGSNLVVAGALDFETTSSYQIKIRATDSGGLSVDKIITTGVIDANDAPVVAGALTATASQGAASFNLNLLSGASDPDNGETTTLAIANVRYKTDNGPVSSTAPAGVSLTGLTLGIDPANPAFAHLAAGAHSTIVVSYDVTDVHGATVAQTGTLTITGVNDAPVVSGAVTGAATEDGASNTLDALLNASDVDDGFLSVTGVPAILPAGVSYNAATHSFTLDPGDPAYQHLAQGETTTVAVTYQVSDGIVTTPASVSWTVTGINDAPVVTGAVTGAAAEDGAASTLNALLNATDADSGAALSVAGVPAILPAGVTYNAAAHSFTLDPGIAYAYQHLALGQTATVTVNYQVTDGIASTSASVSWIVTGVNDPPLEDSGFGNATEDGPTVTVNVIIADVDDNATLSVIVPSIAGITYNSFAHSFTLDPANAAYQHLAQGETTTVVVNYQVSDGIASTPGSASWTVTGVNDAPVFGGIPANAGYVENAAPAILAPALTISDVDDTMLVNAAVRIAPNTFRSGDTISVNGIESGLIAGTNISVSHGLSGSGTLFLSGSDTLAHYQSVLRSISFHSTSEDPTNDDLNLTRTIEWEVDNSSPVNTAGFQSMTLSVSGANDAPLVTVNPAQPAGVSEDGTLTSTVIVSKSDPDAGDVTHYDMTGWTPTALNGDHGFGGHFYRYVSSAGISWTDARAQATALGGHLANVTSAAENSFIQNNVKPNVAAWIGASDAAQEGTWTWADGPEAGQTFWLGNGSGMAVTYANWWGTEPNGGISENYAFIDQNGVWTDVPVTNYAPQGFIVEFDDFSSYTTYSLGNTFGNSVFDITTGQLTFNLDNNSPAVQALGGGDHRDIGVNIVVKDQNGAASTATVTFGIDGANDAPVNHAPVANDDSNAISGNSGDVSGNVLTNDTDADDNTLTVTNVLHDVQDPGTITVDGTYGKLVVTKATGAYTYTLGVTQQQADAITALADGVQQADSFTYTASDGIASSDAELTITVTGVNEAPVIDAATLDPVAEDVTSPLGQSIGAIFSGKFSDADNGASFKGIAVIANNATLDQGVWQYQTSPERGWENVGIATEAEALAFDANTLLRFVPAANFSGTPGGLDVRGLDDTYDEEFTIGGVSGGGRYTINTTFDGDEHLGHGGSTPISDMAVTLNAAVTPVADTPVVDFVIDTGVFRPAPGSGQTTVNTTTAGTQEAPLITALSEGGYVVVWQTFNGSNFDIVGQRFNASGTPVGSEFAVNSTTAGQQQTPVVTALANDGFVVAWTSVSGSNYDVFAQRFDASGPVGSEFQINPVSSAYQAEVSLASFSDGSFVATWTSQQSETGTDIFAQRYDSAGTTVGQPIDVSNSANGDQRYSVVRALDDGRFIVAWTSNDQDGTGDNIYFRILGGLPGPTILVNTFTDQTQRFVDVAVLADGGFVVVWQSEGQLDGTGDIYAQRFAANTGSVGGELRINTETAGNQQFASVTATDDGGYVVSWVSANQGIRAQYVDASGQLAGDEFRVDTSGSGQFPIPEVALARLNDGSFVVTWHDGNIDGSGNAIAQRHYVLEQVIPEDTAGAIPLNVALADLDGSETLTGLDLTGLPVGATLSDGTHTFTASAGHTSASLMGWTLSELTFRGPENASGVYPVTLHVTVTDQAVTGSDVRSFDTAVSITVIPVHDAPVVTAQAAENHVLSSSGGDVPGRSAYQGMFASGLGILSDSSVTVEFWLKDGTEPTSMVFGFFEYDLLIGNNGDGTSYIGFNTGQADNYYTTRNDLQGQWHHVTAVFATGNVLGSKLYIDGVLQTLQSTGGHANYLATPSDTIHVGGWGVSTQYALAGQIDDVSVWHGERTQTEIIADMQGNITGPRPTLVAEYSFENVSNATGGVIDSSGNGHHGTLSTLTTSNVTVDPTLSHAQSVNEDHVLVFSNANHNGISVSDSDSSHLTVTLTVSHGSLTVTTSGLTVSYDNGTTTLSGPTANINAALNGLSYHPDLNYNGTDALVVTVSDGTLSDTRTIDIAISSVNDAPVIALGANYATFNGHSAASTAASAVASTHTDNVTMEGWVNWNGTGPANQMLFYNGSTSTAGFGVFGFPDGNGHLVLDVGRGGLGSSGLNLGSIAANEWHHVALTRSVSGTFNFYIDGQLQQSWSQGVNPITASDDGNPDNVDRTMIGGHPAFLNAHGFNGSIGEVRIWSEARDANEINQYKNVSLTGNEANLAGYWRLNEAAGTTADDATTGNHNLSLTGGAGFVTDSASGWPASAAARTTAEDTSVAIAGLSISDVDAGANQISVSLDVDHGSLSAIYNGHTISSNSSGTLNLPLANVFGMNAVLATLVYTPDADYYGNDSLHIVVDDLGNSGSGGFKSTSLEVALYVEPVNDAPTITGDLAVIAVRGQAATLTLQDLATIDPDAPSASLVYAVLAQSHGVLTLSGQTQFGGTFTQADVIAGLVAFNADPNYIGAGSFTVTVSDGIAPATAPMTVGTTAVDAQIIVHAEGGYNFVTDAPARTMGGGVAQPGNTGSYIVVNEAANREFVVSGAFTVDGTNHAISGTILSILERTHDDHSPLATFVLNVAQVAWTQATQQLASGNPLLYQALTGAWSTNFVGGPGADTGFGGDAFDVFIGSDGGGDNFDGDFDFDRVGYGHVGGGVNVKLADGTVTKLGMGTVDHLNHIELITGTEQADIFNAGHTQSNPGGFSATSTNHGSTTQFNTDGSFNEFEGRGGDDQITGNGDTRVSYFHATGAVTVNLATGMASGDASVGTDTIISGVNRVRGSFFGDTIIGSDNPAGTSETFEGLAGNDTITGGVGFDRASYASAFGGIGVNVMLAAGAAVGGSDVGSDTLRSIEGISGTDFADVYNALGFTTVATPTNPNAGDTQNSPDDPTPSNFNEFDGNGGNDTVTGNGNTRVAFYNATGGVVATLTAGGAGSAYGNESIGHDTYVSGVTRIRGTEFNDIITGNNADNRLEGHGGNDVLNGGTGDDTLTGGTGSDIFVYRPGYGTDIIVDFNRAEGDRIDLRGTGVTNTSATTSSSTVAQRTLGTYSNGIFTGDSAGVDTLVTTNAAFGSTATHRIIVLGAGALLTSDFILENRVSVAVQTPDGYDLSTLYGSLASSSVSSASDANHIFINDFDRHVTIELIGNGIYNTSTHAWTGNSVTEINILDTTNVNDLTIDPTHRPQPTQDHVLVNTNGWSISADSLFSAISTYNQSNHTDTSSLDFIFNGARYNAVGASGVVTTDDKVHDANDVFFGGGSSMVGDVFKGLDGSDTVDYSHAAATSGSTGITVNLISNTTATGNTGAAAGDFYVSIENIRGTKFNDTLTGDSGDNVLEGDAGNDTIKGGNGFDTASYEHAPGPVTVTIGSSPQNTVSAGTDTFISIENLRGSAYNDALSGNGSSILEGGPSDDILIGNVGGSVTASYEHAVAPVTVNLNLQGQSQDTGGAGTDNLTSIANLTGSKFGDILIGNSADNVFTGLGGNDTFVFASAPGHDTITDFTPNVDKIDLNFDAPFTSSNFNTWLMSHAETVNSDLLIHLDVTTSQFGTMADHDTILLKNVVIANLHANDFILHPGGGGF